MWNRHALPTNSRDFLSFLPVFFLWNFSLRTNYTELLVCQPRGYAKHCAEKSGRSLPICEFRTHPLGHTHLVLLQCLGHLWAKRMRPRQGNSLAGKCFIRGFMPSHLSAFVFGTREICVLMATGATQYNIVELKCVRLSQTIGLSRRLLEQSLWCV